MFECINSPYAILIDADTGTVIAQRNGDERIYPASLTKIMTALIAIEHTDNLNQSVTVPYDFFQQLYEEEASMAGFEPGERVKAKDLLYGVLLPSGAECCRTFAENISGSESAFVKLMNEKANQIGLKNTHFTNCTGLHDRNHTSSVKDIAVLLQYALKIKRFIRPLQAVTTAFLQQINIRKDLLSTVPYFKIKLLKQFTTVNCWGERRVIQNRRANV